MSCIMTASPAELNRLMVKFHPCLDSTYAKFPMSNKRWYQPGEKGPKGEPCFVKGGSPDIVKKDYAYCKNGSFGPGYYSLMTRIAYTNLYSKHQSTSPTTCGCACSAADRKLLDEYDTVRRMLYARQMSPRPCDAAAEKRAMKETEGMAVAAFAGEDPLAYLVSKGAKGATLR